MNINPRLGCDQVTARNSRGDAAVYPRDAVPDGWEVIEVGPPREWLLAQLSSCGQAAAMALS